MSGAGDDSQDRDAFFNDLDQSMDAVMGEIDNDLSVGKRSAESRETRVHVNVLVSV